jgi:hypothetical protein
LAGELGIIKTEIGISGIFTEADLVESACGVAVMVVVVVSAMNDGAVYSPALLIVPHAVAQPDRLQRTVLSDAFETTAVN